MDCNVEAHKAVPQVCETFELYSCLSVVLSHPTVSYPGHFTPRTESCVNLNELMSVERKGYYLETTPTGCQAIEPNVRGKGNVIILEIQQARPQNIP